MPEARAYLYNSTGSADYAGWRLVGWGDADCSGNVTISGRPLSWDSSGLPGTALEYRLVVKMKMDGTASPVTLGNWTVLSRPFGPDPRLVPLGAVLNFSAAYDFGPYGAPPNQWGRFEVRAFYVAFKVVDERGYPLPVTEVTASFCSEYELGSTKGTLVTNEVVPAWMGSFFPLSSPAWPAQVTNGSCGQEFGSFQPYSPNTGPSEFGGAGWIVARVPSIAAASGEGSSLLKNLTVLFKYRGTVVGNFTATRWLPPTGAAWTAGAGIDGRLDSDNRATTLDAELQGNRSQVVVCSVRWVYAVLYDQNRNAWPTRVAKVAAYDAGAGAACPWPGAIVPAPHGSPADPKPSLALIRYPSVNTSVKIVLTWFGVTVNVTLFPSRRGMPGGMLVPGRAGSCDLSDPSNSAPDGVGSFDLYSDMVRIRLKLLGSNQLPAPLEADLVDEIELRLESGAASSAPYHARASYWHGYVALPDSPLSWFLSSSDLGWLGLDEAEVAAGWLPSGTRSSVDVLVRYMGVEVLDTRRSYPVNSTISLNCPGFVGGSPVTDPALTDYDKTLTLYAATHDVCFRVLLGDRRNNVSAPEVPLFLVQPNGERTMVWTDGGGYVTLRDVPEGCYKSFSLLYKMSILKASNVGPEGVKVGKYEPLIDLLFPAYDVNVTVWNFHKTFKLVNVNVSFYLEVNFSDFGMTGGELDGILSSPRSKKGVLPEGWVILERTPSDPSKCPVVLCRTESWSTTSSWPLVIKSMPPANYSARVSVPTGDRSRKAGFREADSNATLYWSGDPWGEVVAVRGPLSVDIRTYVYDAVVETFDASGFPLCLFENSAIILAEPSLPAGSEGLRLRNMQQVEPEREDYNAYLVRFNCSAANVFHSVNASRGANDPDIAAVGRAENYPQQSRYLIGAGNLSQPEYRFVVYYRGILVFNGSITLSNPYVSEENAIFTSAYDYVFKVLNDPLEGPGFGIQNLRAQASWAGLNTSFWPTANLTGAEAEGEFMLLESTKLEDGFDADVVKRMWGPPAGEFQLRLLPSEMVSPYFSSYVAIEAGFTDPDGELRLLVPVWNGSSRIFGAIPLVGRPRRELDRPRRPGLGGELGLLQVGLEGDPAGRLPPVSHHREGRCQRPVRRGRGRFRKLAASPEGGRLLLRPPAAPFPLHRQRTARAQVERDVHPLGGLRLRRLDYEPHGSRPVLRLAALRASEAIRGLGSALVQPGVGASMARPARPPSVRRGRLHAPGGSVGFRELRHEPRRGREHRLNDGGRGRNQRDRLADRLERLRGRFRSDRRQRGHGPGHQPVQGNVPGQGLLFRRGSAWRARAGEGDPGLRLVHGRAPAQVPASRSRTSWRLWRGVGSGPVQGRENERLGFEGPPAWRLGRALGRGQGQGCPTRARVRPGARPRRRVLYNRGRQRLA
ncbi:MAG: hypothetical protein QXF24_09805 [Thermoproteota archaeon]